MSSLVLYREDTGQIVYAQQEATESMAKKAAKILGVDFRQCGILFVPDGGYANNLLTDYRVVGGAIVECAERQKAKERAQSLQEAHRYLDQTDWYYARYSETGEDVPTEVTEKRKQARLTIRQLED